MSESYAINFQFGKKPSEEAAYEKVMQSLLDASPNPMQLRCVSNDTPYSAQFRVQSGGPISLLECQLAPRDGSNPVFLCRRSNSHVARNQSHKFNVVIWQGGDIQLDLCGRSHRMRRGDFVIMDTDTQFVAQMQNCAHAIAIALPSSWTSVGDIHLESTFGKLYAGRRHRQPGIADYVDYLRTHAQAMNALDAPDRIYDILALSLDQRAKSEHGTGLFALIRHHIDLHYADPELRPGKVAMTFGISKRHLHRLFATSGTGFTEYLISKRLSYVCAMLSAQTHQHRTILDLAFSCGFRDINHFGRRFFARYGVTPREFRASHKMASSASTEK